MKLKIILTVIFMATAIITAAYAVTLKREYALLNPLSKMAFIPSPTTLPLLKYSIENLKVKKFISSDIIPGNILNEGESFLSYTFFYTSEGKRVSGMLNMPKKPGTYPVILMMRGYVPREIFDTGVGTKHAGEVFAQNGFITLAPDFLGYGESASPSSFPIEERFETYTTALSLLYSLSTLNTALGSLGYSVTADTGRIGVWGHSNGGHISLTLLEVTGGNYPTSLWAPVSKPFPYSILYYTDEADDNGKSLRKVLATFEQEYDTDKYSLTNYLDFIKAPIILHQGGSDDAVPQKWSDLLYSNLKKFGADVTYHTYPGDDHNFANGSWSTVVKRDIEFYRSHL